MHPRAFPCTGQRHPHGSLTVNIQWPVEVLLQPGQPVGVPVSGVCSLFTVRYYYIRKKTEPLGHSVLDPGLLHRELHLCSMPKASSKKRRPRHETVGPPARVASPVGSKRTASYISSGAAAAMLAQESGIMPIAVTFFTEVLKGLRCAPLRRLKRGSLPRMMPSWRRLVLDGDARRQAATCDTSHWLFNAIRSVAGGRSPACIPIENQHAG